ncbi:MAG: sigma-70 family RNA polymerase sigma factor [Myxococcota bacterium]
MIDEPDESLMQRVARGERDAYDALYARWSGPVFRFLLRRTGARGTAEEALQETWLRVYRFRDRFDPTRSFRSWVFTIAANCGRDAHRPEPEVFAIEPVDGEPTDLRHRLVWGLARLDPDDRKLLLLTVEGFDSVEIGSMLGVGSGAVRMRLSRARERLRAAVGGVDA